MASISKQFASILKGQFDSGDDLFFQLENVINHGVGVFGDADDICDFEDLISNARMWTATEVSNVSQITVLKHAVDSGWTPAKKRGKKKDDSSGEEKVYRLMHNEESVNTVMTPYVLVDSKGNITAIDLYNTNAGIENAESLKTKGYDAYKTFVTISHEDWTFASDASVEVWTDDGIQEAERNSEIPNDRHVVSRIAVSDLIEFYLQHNKTLPDPK